MEKLFKKSVQKLQGYVSPPQIDVRAKLNQNESPFDLPDDIKTKVLAKAAHMPWQRYPVNESPEIKKRLASLYQLKTEQLLLGNGSNQLLQTLLSACLEKGDRVLTCPPTFGLFDLYTSVYDGVTVPVLYPPGTETPRQKILQALIDEKPRLVLLCSPNNPTGAEFETDLVREICALAPGVVMIDEAYAEFSNQSFLPLLQEYQNLIISRTFSKAFSMAGLRLGYFMAQPSLIQQLTKINLPYNINIFTELVACQVLDQKEHVVSRVRMIREERQRLFKALGQIAELVVYPSAANFLLFKYHKASQLISFLKSEGILIRDVGGYPELENHARVTVGSTEDNSLFLDKLLEYITN
ncbi:histidinol-phosphate transaminase [candidate division KSB1 bacterium]|nr:histidinol-phosphate transaminase [candidate division KSB1 bacterium]